MALVLLGARLLLAGVFATAGFAKLADRDASRRAVSEFGVPRRLAWLLGSVLPVVELATAGMLVADTTVRWGALLAIALLLAFSAAIALNLRKGRAPECRCFGQVHSAPVSWRAVARNVALAGLAVVVMAIGPGAGLDPAQALGAGTAIVLGAALLLARATGRRDAAPLGAELEGLPLGTPAPEFELPSHDGDTVTLTALLARGKPLLLLFADVNCGPCIALAPDVARWQKAHAERLTIAVLEHVGGNAGAGPDEYGRTLVLLREDEEVPQTYRAEGTPVAVLVAADGRIASGIAPGAGAIRTLVGSQVGGLETVREPWRLPRRALLLRAAGALAAITPVLSLPARAFAATRRPKPCPTTDSIFKEITPHDCGGKDCTNVFSDSENCRLCGKVCPKGSVCAGGKCVRGNDSGCDCVDRQGGRLRTSRHRVCCDGECVGPAENEKHCGGCGKRCTGKKPKCCWGVCRDLSVDPNNCGTCNGRCPPDKPLCHAGRCRKECPAPLERCGSTCGSRSRERCCGSRLYSKEQYPVEEYGCCGGTLKKNDGKKSCGPDCKECGANEDCCGGECTSIIQEKHCGACFHVCPEPMACRLGECYCPPERAC